MAVSVLDNDVVGAGGAATPLSQFILVGATGNPAYLVVDLLDRNEYTAAATGRTGTLSGAGHTLGLIQGYGDAREAGVVFTWNAATGQYVNATYGSLGQFAYTQSASAHDVTDLALFGASSLLQAQSDAADIYNPIGQDSPGFLGSVSFVTDPTGKATPTQATPLGIAAAAQNLVGQAWNSDGCWVLASTIAAEAGAGLPVQSTAVDVPSVGNGEWMVAYDGPVSSNPNWESLVATGDVVSFVTRAGGGHVTTCVSGSGASAQLVDNITYVDAAGDVLNSAHDGSPNDILIASPHAEGQEFGGVAANSVVIYALDTPAVTDRVASASVPTGNVTSLATWFAASDPAQKAVTRYQAYLASGTDRLLLSGQAVAANSAANAVSATSLSSLSLLAGSAAGTDTVEVRAQNSAGYWGDWQALSVHVAAPAPKPPTVVLQEPNQTWHQGQVVSLTLPVLFSDPQGQALRYAASGMLGAALPSWLHFNTTTRTFSGTVSASPGGLTVVVTATDTAGLSASERITIAISTNASAFTSATPSQGWKPGSAAGPRLGSGVFADPHGQTTNASHASIYDIFSASVGPGTAGLVAAGDWVEEGVVAAQPSLPSERGGDGSVLLTEVDPGVPAGWHAVVHIGHTM